MGKIKKAVKKYLDHKTGFRLLDYSQLPETAEYVSFDIFDTLIVRDVNKPSDVFGLMEKKLKMKGFADKRIKAERISREKKPGGEVDLSEIYQSFEGIAESEAESFISFELQTELSVCRPNPSLTELYRKCVRERKVILVSDMYLTSEMMEKILEKCGITGYEKLYISCEAGVSKRNGGLYRYVLDDLDISPDKLVHIGNDFMTDFVCAIREHIPCYKIKTTSVHIKNSGAVLEVNVDDLNFGGVYSLVRNVIKNNSSSLELDIAAIEPFGKKENIRELRSCGTRIFYIGCRNSKLKKQATTYFGLKKLIKDNGYRCVHIHSDAANKLLICGLAAKRAKAERIILHSHSSGIDNDKPLLRLLVHRSCRRVLKYIGTDFVSCSDKAAEWMFPNVPQNKVLMINNGVDISKFRFDASIREKVRAELGVENQLLIGHVGRFNYQKNHKYLIKVMKEIDKKHGNAILLLVGGGDGEEETKKLVRSLGLNDKVIFCGVSNRVNELMQAMDIFVLPSRFEGLPIVGVEAQAAGLPVVFSDRITRSAALTDDAVFCPIRPDSIGKWADAVIDLSNRHADRSASFGILKDRCFDIDSTVDQLLKLYEQ